MLRCQRAVRKLGAGVGVGQCRWRAGRSRRGGVDERLHDVERQREDDGGILLTADLGQRLQIAELQRGRVAGDHVGGVAQPPRGLELALGVDHVRPSLSLRLGAERHRALHLGGYLDVLDLDRRDLDPPRVGVLVDDVLERLVELLALGQQHVEVRLAEHRAQRGLCDLRGGQEIALDLDDRAGCVDHAEVADRVHPGGHVVARDQVLRRDVQRDGAEIDSHHPVDGGDQQDQPGALHAEQATEPEDDGALVLAQDADRRCRKRQHHCQQHADKDDPNSDDAHGSSHSSARRTDSVSPRTCSTTTCSPSTIRAVIAQVGCYSAAGFPAAKPAASSPMAVASRPGSNVNGSAPLPPRATAFDRRGP
jgi:hypothetical protein